MKIPTHLFTTSPSLPIFSHPTTSLYSSAVGQKVINQDSSETNWPLFEWFLLQPHFLLTKKPTCPVTMHDAITVTLSRGHSGHMGGKLWKLWKLWKPLLFGFFPLSPSFSPPWQSAVVLSLIWGFASSVKVRIWPLVTFGLESDFHKIRARIVKSRHGDNDWEVMQQWSYLGFIDPLKCMRCMQQM